MKVLLVVLLLLGATSAQAQYAAPTLVGELGELHRFHRDRAANSELIPRAPIRQLRASFVR